jgi:hypothetical protein
MKIINRTPHAISIYPSAVDDGPSLVLPAAPRDQIARVAGLDVRHHVIELAPGAAPITKSSWGRIIGLPSPAEEVMHVVSVVVVEAARAASRSIADLLVPGGQIRNASGQIVGCSSLGLAESALPSSIAADWVRAMRSMGATALRGPVWHDGTHVGIWPDAGYPFTIHALTDTGRVVGSIEVESDQYPLTQAVAAVSVEASWLAAGGTIDPPGPVSLRLGEQVMGTCRVDIIHPLPGGQVVEDPRGSRVVGRLVAGGVSVEIFDERRVATGSRLIDREMLIGLRPFSTSGLGATDI